ncbi:hypothetical protein SAMN05421823_10540 [Catalinimonas alkaloidigena]|uniref:Adhesin n=1 Tax=Catalinimonas alkaloidigena TaxID=1075417 RepID=A0A1G9ILH8_9BACT|nr:hypothetical protein [Catalinimonas alkaloidigena]SDL26021.1 hypothetical protein SAMN05421823_10540 [Catalinimonas alkaloidigena]
MKPFLPLLCGLALCVSAHAQKQIEQTYAVKPTTEVKLDLPFATTIAVTPGQPGAVVFQASVSINDGQDDDAFQYRVTQTDDRLSLESEIENLKELSRQHYHDRNVYSADDDWLRIYITLQVPPRQSVYLRTISGDVELDHNGGPLDVQSVGGDVELRIAESQSARFDLKTIGGEIFTNLDLPTQPQSGRFQVGAQYEGDWHGGQVPITLASTGSNLYIRKKE